MALSQKAVGKIQKNEGPDVESKSHRTQFCYKDLLKDQKNLEDLGCKKAAAKSESDLPDDEDNSISRSNGFGKDTFEVHIENSVQIQ
jgi:hypothetical protein